MRGTKKLQFATCAAILCATSGALAALLNVMPQHPQTTFENADQTVQHTTYNAASREFSVSGIPVAIQFATSSPRLVTPFDGVRALTIDIQVGQDGLLMGGHPDEDLLIIGTVTHPDETVYSGVLLTGEITAFGYLPGGGLTSIFEFRFTLTGGALAPLFNDHDIGLRLTSENSTFTGSFDANFTGGAKGVVGPIPLVVAPGGCTPGYWKQPHHYSSYPAPYAPDTLFEAVFQRDVPGDPTLVEALRLKGGHLNALMRHASAALLNAAHPQVNPNNNFVTPAAVINAFQQAFDSGDYETLKNHLEYSNEQGCPL